MRTIVDIPKQDIHGLDTLCGRKHISRAEAVRRAITDYLRLHQGDDTKAAFGLWQGRQRDGLTYQDGVRDEWRASTVHEPDKV